MTASKGGSWARREVKKLIIHEKELEPFKFLFPDILYEYFPRIRSFLEEIISCEERIKNLKKEIIKARREEYRSRGKKDRESEKKTRKSKIIK